MRNALVCLLVSVAGVWGMCASEAHGAPGERPNIVFILADDIGYGDLSCYGAKKVRTPHIDRLAREGRRFADAHSPAATCSPSRRALLTGTYSWRQQPGSGILPGDAPLSIPPGSPTLASMLKRAGYTTGLVGKWHLGLGGEQGPDWNGEIRPGPLEVGFDWAYYLPATGDRVPCVYIENYRVVGLSADDPIEVNYKHKIGNEPTGRENPELLELNATRGHDMTIVNGVGRIGWMRGGKSARWSDAQMADTLTSQAIRFVEEHKEKPFFLYFAPHNIHVPRVPAVRHRGKSECGTRGDAIVELDASVGRLLDTLERLKLSDKTLVVFTSDNGGVMDDGYEDVGSFEHPCNAALRGYKGTLWEGGHRVPFIARWPGHIAAGSECDELVTLLDMYATFAALTTQQLPRDGALDSMNVLPALLGRAHERPGRREFIAHVYGTQGPFAVRQDAWKLVQGGGRRGYSHNKRLARKDVQMTTAPQLFDLARDLEEKHNLSQMQPDKVKQLEQLLARRQAEGRSRPE